MRENESTEKAIVAKHNASATRGFTTDQCIDIESSSLKKATLVDRKNEAALVGLSVEDSALTKLIEAAERQALSRRPK